MDCLEVAYMRSLSGSFQELRQDALQVEGVIADSRKKLDLAEQRGLKSATNVDFVAMAATCTFITDERNTKSVAQAFQRHCENYALLLKLRVSTSVSMTSRLIR